MERVEAAVLRKHIFLRLPAPKRPRTALCVASMGTAFSAMLLSSGVPQVRPAVPLAVSETSAAALASPIVAPAVPDEQPQAALLNPVTRAYAAAGYFTGITSAVLLPQPPAMVYESLAKDLQRVFGPIEECKDSIMADDGMGRQWLQRDVRIPFTISYFSGCIKLKLDVENNPQDGKINFESLSQGRFLSKFTAAFDLRPVQGADGSEYTSVQMDARIVVKRLPPPPLKNLVKGVVVRKMDRCMRDLAEYHSGRCEQANEAVDYRLEPVTLNNIQPSPGLRRLMSTERRSQRPSLL